jgi:LPXTG-motif cell wall-anchored protein
MFDFEWYQWLGIVVLIALIVAFVMIRKKQNR